MTPPPDEARDALRIAANLIESGLIKEPGAAGAKLRALPIKLNEREVVGWFVGLVSGDRLLGFAQLDRSLAFRRYASFRGREPLATDWLDPDRILDRARGSLRADETLGEPFLGYDGNPDRLAWVVPVLRLHGTQRQLMVAGEAVFEATHRDAGG
jgi:hypothetical protein